MILIILATILACLPDLVFGQVDRIVVQDEGNVTAHLQRLINASGPQIEIVFDNVALAMVDVDKRPEIARKLMGGKKGVPQFVIFHKRDGGSGWRRLTVNTVNSKTILKAIKSVGVSHP